MNKLVSSLIIIGSVAAFFAFFSFKNRQTPNVISQEIKGVNTVEENQTQASPSASVVTAAKEEIITLKPQKRRINLGVVVEDYSNKTGQLNALEKELGSKIQTVSIFKQFGLSYNNHINLDDLSYIKSSGKKLLLAWEPWNPQEGMGQSNDYLKQINDGAQDGYIRSFAQNVKSYQGKVILRFGHEANGDWYPWGGRPEEYKAAFRKVVAIFREEGVSNVSFMWSVNAYNQPSSPISTLSAYYPGNDVVDLIGIDGFNFGTSRDFGGWKSFYTLFAPPYKYLSTNYKKPIYISETSSSESGGNKSEWINQMFLSLYSDFPKVEEVVWFNLIKEADWRVNSSKSSLETFRDNLNSNL